MITFYIIKYGDKMRAGIDIVFRLSKIIVSFHRQSCKTVLNFSSLKYVEFEGSIQAIDFWFGSLNKNSKDISMILVISKQGESTGKFRYTMLGGGGLNCVLNKFFPGLVKQEI